MVSIISALAATVPVAAGAAMALRYQGQERRRLQLFRRRRHQPRRLARGRQLRHACRKLPVVFICNNNQYAYSTPLNLQMACANVADRGPAYNMPAEIVDGNDVLAVHEATQRAVDHARAGNGPYLLECKTFRMTGHSAHDAAHYVPKGLFDEWGKLDPIVRLEAACSRKAGPTQAEIERSPRRACARKWTRRWRGPSRAPIPTPPPCSTTCTKASNPCPPPIWKRSAKVSGKRWSATPTCSCIGEDIGVYGGAFKVTAGFIEHFGEKRVVDTPISEAAIVGAAIGAGLMGLRPVAEMQFADFISCGFDQIVNFAAKCRYRWNAAVPIVVRAPSGGGIHGGPFHSQNPEMWFVRTPGLKVVCAVHRVRRQGADQIRHSR